MRGAVLLFLLSLIRLVVSGHQVSPVLPGGAADALPELLQDVEEVRERDSVRSMPLAPGETLDPNRSEADELDRLPGVGPQLALAIVLYRTTEGGFSRMEDLLHVPGIGPATLSRIRPHLRLSGGVTRLPPLSDPTFQPLDLNRATLEELQELPGIGPALSQRILESRSREGPFKTPDELVRVPGIGPVVLAKLLPLIRVGQIS